MLLSDGATTAPLTMAMLANQVARRWPVSPVTVRATWEYF
jgi:hypothetical protein